MEGIKEGLRDRVLEGFKQLKAGDLDAARTTFSQLVRTNPRIVAAHLGLGRVYFQENDLSAALKCFQDALARNPKSSHEALIARARRAWRCH
jgi:Tfp pilus assembly protein PilF